MQYSKGFLGIVRTLAPTLLIMITSGTSPAAILVQYNFTSASPSATATNSTAGSAAWVGLSGSGFSSGTSSAFIPTNISPASLDTGKYLTLTLSADPGYQLNLSSVTFAFGGQSNGTTTITDFTQLRSDAEAVDYSTSLDLNLDSGSGSVSGGNTAQTSFISNSNVYSGFSADLTGTSYQNLSNITFRWYVYDDVSTNAGFDRFDSAVINGSIAAIPEPASWALFFAGGTSLLLLCRFKRNSLK